VESRFGLPAPAENDYVACWIRLAWTPDNSDAIISLSDWQHVCAFASGTFRRREFIEIVEWLDKVLTKDSPGKRSGLFGCVSLFVSGTSPGWAGRLSCGWRSGNWLHREQIHPDCLRHIRDGRENIIENGEDLERWPG
jgi:hypothetical protein